MYQQATTHTKASHLKAFYTPREDGIDTTKTYTTL